MSKSNYLMTGHHPRLRTLFKTNFGASILYILLETTAAIVSQLAMIYSISFSFKETLRSPLGSIIFNSKKLNKTNLAVL